MGKPCVLVSGGADSTAMALLLWERGEDFDLMFSDTDAEFPETYHVLVRLAKLTGRHLRIITTPGLRFYLDFYHWKLPGPRLRWCTRLLKAQPTNRSMEATEAEWGALGIRADEPHRAARRRNARIPIRFPLVEAGLGKKDAHRLCCRHGLLHPVYSWRSNVSCFCCFFQRISDWRGLLRNYPTLFALAEKWESFDFERSGRTWTLSGRTLGQLRRADQSQLRLWPDPDGEPCLICAH